MTMGTNGLSLSSFEIGRKGEKETRGRRGQETRGRGERATSKGRRRASEGGRTNQRGEQTQAQVPSFHPFHLILFSFWPKRPAWGGAALQKVEAVSIADLLFKKPTYDTEEEKRSQEKTVSLTPPTVSIIGAEDSALLKLREDRRRHRRIMLGTASPPPFPCIFVYSSLYSYISPQSHRFFPPRLHNDLILREARS